MNGGSERRAMPYLKVLFWHSPGETEEKNKNLEFG